MAKLLAAAALLTTLFAVPLAGTASAQPCAGYTATSLTASPTSVVAGGSVTLSGLGSPFTVVTAQLLTPVPSTIGSGFAGPGGAFSFSGTIPALTAPGVYVIQATSGTCSAFTVSITVTAPLAPFVAASPPAPTTTVAPTTTAAPTTTTTVAPTTTAAPTTTTPSTALSSCSASAAGRTFIPGQDVLWTLDSSGFDTNKNVRLRIRKVGSSNILYGLGAWPSGNQTTVTMPVSLNPGTYIFEQLGYNPTGKITSKSCSVTISATPAAAAADAPGGSSLPFAALAIGAVTLAGLIQLRFRRMRRAA